MTRSPAWMLIVAAGVVAAVVGTAAPAAAQPPAVEQRFAADSGDNCRYGSTEGILVWEAPVVGVAGTVSDRPLPADPGPFCPDDGFHTIAHFQAFTGNLLVDSESPRVNNDRLEIRFVLEPTLAPVTRIDRVVVTVCREPLNRPGIGYCGKPQTYPPPNVTG
jgi:hypothetical protein